MSEIAFCEFIDSQDFKSQPIPTTLLKRMNMLIKKAEDARPKMSKDGFIGSDQSILVGEFTGP